MSEDVRVYPWDGSDTTLILAYECEQFTMHPATWRKDDPRLAFQAAYAEACARDEAAAAALLDSVETTEALLASVAKDRAVTETVLAA